MLPRNVDKWELRIFILCPRNALLCFMPVIGPLVNVTQSRLAIIAEGPSSIEGT